MIPKIIHQIWLGPLKAPIDSMRSWQTLHPDWEYRLWTEKNLLPLKNQEAFDRSDNYPQKADILRYEILEKFGGVYIDADVYCLRSINPLMDKLAEEGVEVAAAYEGRADDDALVANTVIMSEPGSSLVAALVEGIDIQRDGPAWEVTGPKYFTEKIQRLKPNIALLDSRLFFPIHHRDRANRVISKSKYDADKDVYGIHLWSGTKRGYSPVWYRDPLGYILYVVRKRFKKIFQLMP